MILGLTGSLGSGKSTVAELMRTIAEAVVIDADSIVYDLQKPGTSVFEQIIKEFGSEIVRSDGSLDRKQLAALVFTDATKRQRLNEIVHPAVYQEEVRLLEKYKNAPLVVLMVPLLFEVGMEKLTDKTAVVVVGEPERHTRLMERSGLTPIEIQTRLDAQMSQEDKIRKADYIINNSGTLEATRAQVAVVLHELGIPIAPRLATPAPSH
jgi:dephospho-CoA kinase